MRCKNHYTDLSSIAGVCASCLRERLFYLVAAQEQAHSQSQSQTLTLEDTNCNSETHPVFPRSVSPYISRRKLDNQRNTDRNRQFILPDQRFFSTPQLAPITGGSNSNSNSNYSSSPFPKKKHSFIRFSLLTKLFRSRKQKENELESDPRVSVSVSNSRGSCGGGDSATSAMSSPFWFSGGGSRKKKVMRKQQYCSDRGMSPVRYSDCREDELCDGSSGYETCESRKQTPWRTPAHSFVRRGGGSGGGNGKNVSGLAFCLSPLVRASPCRNWSLKGPVSTAADGGDMRAPVKPHLSNTKSFCANRSRKLADFGRSNTNR